MDAKEQIKTCISLEEIITETVTLKSAGKNRLVGLCPFHNEKTPSFTVSTDKGLYHCHGCKASGDVFSFVMASQGLDFWQALEKLAKRAGLELPDDHGPSSIAPRRPRETPAKALIPSQPNRAPKPRKPWIGDFINAAHTALQRQETETARAAADYLAARGLAHLIDDLHLGVVDKTVKLEQAKYDKQLWGKLRALQGRAIFPTLEDGKGIWFKGRYMGPLSDVEAKAKAIKKYDGPSGSVPAPFNPVGLQNAVAKNLPLLMVEGEPDAASVLAAYGVDYPVIGLPGGNLPQGYAERVAESDVSSVYLLMDPDEAGVREAERASSALSALGVRVYVVTLPGTCDLNELLVQDGPEALRQTLNDLFESTTLASTSDLLYIRDTWLGELDARANRPHAAYTTGLEALDTLLGGGYAEGLHLLGGITGGGKTSFALHVALTNALQGRPVIYASYEQSRLELWARLASGLTSVPYQAIKRGTYDDGSTTLLTSSVLKSNKAWSDLEQASKFLKIVEGGDALSRQTSAYTVETLAKTADDIAGLHGAPPLIVMDYLQRVPVPTELRIRDIRERVGYVAGRLQVLLARDLGCPVLALSSIGRASYSLQEASLEQRLGALKEAGELEYTAYTSLLLYGLSEGLQFDLSLRPGAFEKYKPMTLDLVKNREGEIGQLAAKWHIARGSWAEAVPVENAVAVRGLR